MGIGYLGPKGNFKKTPLLESTTIADTLTIQTVDMEKLALQNRVFELENELAEKEAGMVEIVEVIKEIPVEVVKEVRVVEERIIEKEVQVIKEFPVIKDRIVKEFVDVVREIEVIKEVEKQVKVVPFWVYGALGVQTLAIIILLLK
jgi:hypothetical protein